MKKIILLFFVFLLFSTAVVVIFVCPAVAEETIYIRPDGTVEGTDKIQRDGDVYTFADDIFDYIVVEKDNIVVDGAGFTLQGNGTGKGITLTGRSNVTIKNIQIRSFRTGLLLEQSSANNVSGNTISNSSTAIFLDDSDYNSIAGNNITDNGQGIFLKGMILLFTSDFNIISKNCIVNNECGIGSEYSYDNSIHANNITHNKQGIWLAYSSRANATGNNLESNNEGFIFEFNPDHNRCVLRNNRLENNTYHFQIESRQFPDELMHDIDTSNTVDGKPVYYWINEQDKTVPVDAGYVALINCTNITVQNLNLSKNGQGVLLVATTNSTIANNIIIHNRYGIFLNRAEKNNVSENTLTENSCGIRLDVECYNNSLCENNVKDNGDGIYLYSSAYNVLRDNRLENNTYNLRIPNGFRNYIDTSNTVDGKPVYYWINEQDKTVPVDAGYVALINCVNVTVHNLNLSKNFQGVLVANTVNSTIAKNIISNTRYGIHLKGSSNNDINQNIITNTGDGIWFDDSPDNIVERNTLLRNSYGLGIFLSSRNTICGNNIANNDCGVLFHWDSRKNKFYHNNFINNTKQASFNPLCVPPVVTPPTITCDWDCGYPFAGNYWSDHTGFDNYRGIYQNETGSDGIVDTPLDLIPYHTDKYPLASPISIFDAGTWNNTTYKVDVISNFTVSDFCFNPDDKPFIRFNVTGEVGSVGFCRVSFSKDMLSAEDGWIILVGGQEVTSNTIQNENRTYLYFTYAHSMTIVEIRGTHAIPELRALMPILIMLIVLTTAIAICKSKLSKKDAHACAPSIQKGSSVSLLDYS